MKRIIFIVLVACICSCASQKSSHVAYKNGHDKFQSGNTLRKREAHRKAVKDALIIFILILIAGKQVANS